MKIKNNSIIKIPDNISLIYCSTKKILIISGPVNKKSIKIKLRLVISNSKKFIKVSLLPFSRVSNDEKKKLKALQGTTAALIKQTIIETSVIMYKKLKLIGVGYRITNIENFENQLVTLKLGLSHELFYGNSNKIKLFCKKRTQLFILGNSYQYTNQVANFIRDLKKPEPYKGKGILYSDEIINLKKGKKV